jgi:uncharacterized RDD family membrane protein YckC
MDVIVSGVPRCVRGLTYRFGTMAYGPATMLRGHWVGVTEYRGDVAVSDESVGSLPPGLHPVAAHSPEHGYWNGREWDRRPIASVFSRSWAFILDLVLVSLIWIVIATIAAGLVGGDGGSARSAATGIFIVFIAPAVAFLGYFTLLFTLTGRTLGMLLAGLYVIDIPSGADQLTWGKALLRSFVLLIGVYFLVTAIIWLVLTAGSKTRQGPHDLAAKTVVLRKQKVVRYRPPVDVAPTAFVDDTAPPLPEPPPPDDPPSDVEHPSSDIEPNPESTEVFGAAVVPAEAFEESSTQRRALIFISHATEDAETAFALSAELEAQGFNTWLATRDVGIGTNYAAEIVRAVSNANYLLVLLSPASIESPHVRREVSIAIDRNVQILPVSADPTGEFMANLPVDWTYWLSLAQVFRMSDAANTAAEIARRLG